MENHIYQNQPNAATHLGDGSNNMEPNISIYSFQDHSNEDLMPNEGNKLVLSSLSNNCSSIAQQHYGKENKTLLHKRWVASPLLSKLLYIICLYIIRKLYIIHSKLLFVTSAPQSKMRRGYRTQMKLRLKGNQ